MRKTGVTWSVTSEEKKHENEGSLDSVTSATDGVVVVGSLGTQSVLFFVLKGRVCTQL